MATKVYFFRDGEYVSYDREEGAGAAALKVAGNWPGLAEVGFDKPDAALNLNAGKLYFFKGDSYVRYDVPDDHADAGYPLKIADNWPGMAAAGFASNIDAAVNWGNGKAYFFKGDSYLRYDIAKDQVDPGYPFNTGAQWPGLAAAGFASGIEAVINWGNGKAYFFKGDNYLRYDMASDQVDPGYPRRIADQWPGMAAAGFASGVRSATDVFDGRDMWLDTAERMPAPVNGPTYLPMPWRGVLHTTEGPTIAGALQTFQATNFWPTMTIEPHTFRIVQHYSLNAGARALSDHATPENAARCVQIEIVGFAAQAPTWAPEELAFIRDVVRRIDDMVPIPRSTDRSFLDAAGVSANPQNRMSVEEWRRFSGWCGHQHVPGESHWDPGGLDISSILR